MTITHRARRAVGLAITASLLIWAVLDWEGGCEDVHGGVSRTSTVQGR